MRQAFTVVVILWFGATKASTSDDIQLQDLLSLPTDINLGIVVPRVFSNFASEALLDRFGANCLRAAIRVENAPAGQIFLVIEKLLRSDRLGAAFGTEDAPHSLISQIIEYLQGPDQLRYSQLFGPYVLEALELAYDVGHCDLIPVLSSHLRNSPSYRGDFSSPHFDRASCDDVARLAALPLEQLLGMHALPRHRFLQVIDIKYRSSGYGSFFHDPAWYSKPRSSTVMSHALHLYEQLNGEFDFEPVPFGRIASTQNMSEPALRSILEDPPSDPLWRTWFSLDDPLCILSYLQLVLKPESNLRFWPSSDYFRTRFLAEACLSGRLDWIKFMLEHDLWRNVELPDVVIFTLRTLGRDGDDFFVRYADLLEVDDPVHSAFKMVFFHQMRLRPSYRQALLLQKLIMLGEFANPARDQIIVRD